MKAKFLLLILFASLATTKPIFSQQKDTDPIELLGRTIPHGIPVEITQDLRNFLITLYNDEGLCNGFVNYVQKTAAKDSIPITGIYRGNMIDFKASFDSLYFTYHLWLDPTQDEEVYNIVYYYKGKSLIFDDWIYPRINVGKQRQVALSALDSDESFNYHIKIAATMMKAGIFIPHPLSVRISYNLSEKIRQSTFFDELKNEKLALKYYTNGDVFADNGNRSYRILFGNNPGITFEVTPKW